MKRIIDDNWNVTSITEGKKKKPYDSITFDAGNIDYNIKMFNNRWGDNIFDHSYINGTIDPGSEAGCTSTEESTGSTSGASSGEGMGESLVTEAKDRNIRRYYIRPQNVYCATKKDVLEALVKAGDQNCSVYSLKRLDNKDKVNLLTTNDILYYYDNRVLYDKNHVQVVDYNLNIKKEEDRRRFTDIDSVPVSSAEKEYTDRLTDFNVDDKDIDEAFNQDFDRINALDIKEDANGNELEHTCCICGETFTGYGNTPEPYMPAEDKDGNKNLCCDSCYQHFVVPAQENQDNVENNQSDENLEEKVNNTDKTLWVRKLQDIISKKEPYIVTLPNGKKVKAITPTEIDAKSGKVYYSEKDFDGWEW